ncbi:hypothetical protein CDV31_001413 [Fusarium ambrosium]|uniref:Uncharacterized protein n=1 Tax=Fusarium ambrosium TaxID=131363 RepID=A0A428UZU2_9HYPO|nr:hypothetical protein CDV31_001413 [Fusarium ambrosium]
MKWYSLLSASLLLGTVIAVDPMPQLPPMPTKYRLMVTTHGVLKDIDDKYLSYDPEGNIGIFTTDQKPVLIHDIMAGKKSGDGDFVIFDARPGDEIFYGLGLLGWEGNMHFREIRSPDRFQPDKNADVLYTPNTYSWNEFWFADGMNGMRELFWGAKGDRPGWVAVPLVDETYFIRWYNGSQKASKHWAPVKIYLSPFEL